MATYFTSAQQSRKATSSSSRTLLAGMRICSKAILLPARHADQPRSRPAIATLMLACICLAPLLAPCGEPEPSFNDSVRRHLARAGYLSPLDTLRPFEATLHADGCRLARAPRNCACEVARDRIAISFGS